MFRRAPLFLCLLALARLVIGCDAAPPSPTAQPTMPPPSATATPSIDFTWQIDRVLRASAIPSRSKLVAADQDKVFIVILATVQNSSGKQQAIFESRTHIRVQKAGSSDWIDFGIDGAATGAAGDTFGLTGMNFGFMGTRSLADKSWWVGWCGMMLTN